MKGKISKKGYRKDSLDRFNDFNIIPSNNISMKNVNHPILGISDLNDIKMMYPEQDYKFKGNSVTEFPIMKKGGKMKKYQQGGNFPTFNNKLEHDTYHTNKVIERLQIEEPGLYTKYNELITVGDTNNATAIIMAGGGIPAFIPPKGSILPKNPTKFSDIGFKKNKPEGFRYMTNQPDEDSITRRMKKGQQGAIIPLKEQLNEILLKTALLKERQFKRDSVMNSLMQVPTKPGQVSKGMIEYYKTEPQEYMNLDVNLLDDKRKKDLLKKYGKKAQWGTGVPSGFSMNDIPQEGVQIDSVNSDQYEQYQEAANTFYGQQYSNIPSTPQQSRFGKAWNNIGGANGLMQGANAVGYGLSGDIGDDGGPSAGQKIVGQFGPWGQLISQVSQIGTKLGDEIGGNVGGAVSGMFNPSAALTNKDLSKRDRVFGAVNPIYGGIKAYQAKKAKKDRAKKLESLVNEANSLGNTDRRRYVRPEDQYINPNELSSSYGVGTSYLKHGGNVPNMETNGQLQTYWGGEAEQISENPFLPNGGETVLFKGNSHKDGGIGMKFGGSPVEVEGGEPAVKLKDGKKDSLIVFGDMKIPSYGVSELNDPKAKNKKFKNYIKDLSKTEDKQNKIVEEGVELVNDTPLFDSFDKLKFSSGKAMIEGGNMKLKQIAAKKQIAANVQNAILETAEELGLKSDQLAKGKIMKDRKGKGKNAQNGTGYMDPNERSVLQNQLEGTDPSFYTGFGNYSQYYPIPEGTGNASRPFIPQKRRPSNTIPSEIENPNIDNLFLNRAVDTDYLYNIPPYGKIPQLAPISQSSSVTSTTPSNTATQGEPNNQMGNVSWMDVVNSVLPYIRPSNQTKLDRNQLTGEMYALATNQLEPVKAQLYQPLLENVSDISLQDQLNANQADFNSLQRLTASNPAAQSMLASQKYAANSSVLGEQFRQNQNQKMSVYNRNRGVLNDATLKNLAILDQQYVRQSQAKSNTKAVAQQALTSIADKIAKHKLENRTLGIYENLYNYRYDNKGRVWNMNPLAQFNVDSGVISVDKDGKVVVDETKVKTDRNGMIINSTDTQRVIDDRRNKSTKNNQNGGIVRAIKSL